MSVLPALKGCYDRLAEDQDSGIAPFGYKIQQISLQCPSLLTVLSSI